VSFFQKSKNRILIAPLATADTSLADFSMISSELSLFDFPEDISHIQMTLIG